MSIGWTSNTTTSSCTRGNENGSKPGVLGTRACHFTSCHFTMDLDPYIAKLYTKERNCNQTRVLLCRQVLLESLRWLEIGNSEAQLYTGRMAPQLSWIVARRRGTQTPTRLNLGSAPGTEVKYSTIVSYRVLMLKASGIDSLWVVRSEVVDFDGEAWLQLKLHPTTLP